MACNKLGTGKSLIISYAIEDCTATPLTTATTPISTWKTIGFTQSTSENVTARTTTANVDDQSTTLGEYLGLDVSIDVSVLDAVDVTDKINQQALRDHQLTNGMAIPPVTPKVWIRVHDTLLSQYRYYYCMMGDTARSGETEGNRTGSFNFVMVPTFDATNREYQKEAIV